MTKKPFAQIKIVYRGMVGRFGSFDDAVPTMQVVLSVEDAVAGARRRLVGWIRHALR